MSAKPYAEVIVDVNAKRLDRVFHYRVPAERRESLVEGMRVKVPFGNRTVEGYVLGFCEKPDVPDNEIKDITEIIQSEPWLDPDLLALAGWMSERYMCSRLDAVNSMVPAWAKGKGSRKLVKPRTVKALRLGVEDSVLDEILPELEKKAARQAKVLKVLREKGPMSAGDLADAAGTTPATVRQVVQKGLLVVEETEVRRDPYGAASFPQTVPLRPTGQQLGALRKIVSSIDQGAREVFLLHGVTGSGKTEVYMQAIAHCLDRGREAAVLVPEISLTPQMVERFKGRFGELVAVLHSRLSTGERYDEWRMIKTGRVKVVVGARSAVFAPFRNLGLFIIDEEHETSYKQEDHPKYHAREVAIARARQSGGVVVLGSATPSLESYARASAGRYRLLELGNRVMDIPLPFVEVVDLREELHAGHRSVFSRGLIEKLKGVLERGEQAILFLNRRGYSTFVVCRDCGLVMRCPRCSISLTLHTGENQLRCHYCDHRRDAPRECPGCGSKTIRHFGVGTQKVEEEAARWFPQARIARMDVDTTGAKGAHEKILNSFKEGSIDILVGTQMIAKGLDFPRVTLVGVITADTALNLPDFRAAEKTFQLMTQVAGRAGRGSLPGEVLIQTYNPDHYSIINAKTHNYRGFYFEEIANREALGYPPFCALVRILVYGSEENRVIRGAEQLALYLMGEAGLQNLGVEEPVLGPSPAPLARLRNRHRWQICLKGRPAGLLRQIIREARKKTQGDNLFAGLSVSIDVDPMSLM